jgi:hypothetical protein
VYARAYEALDDRNIVLELLALFELMSSEIDKARTAAFAKRLMTMALHAPSDVAAVVLAYIRQLFETDPSMTAAVDFEFEAQGRFDILLDNPDFCNGPAARYWELSELCRSPNRYVREIALELSTLTNAEALMNSGIQAAKEKRDWRPKTILEQTDDSERVFDMNLLAQEFRPLPKAFKVYNFE